MPLGASNLKAVPSARAIESLRGSKSVRPAKAMAVTISGEAKKLRVLALPSLRALKLRLNEVKIAFSSLLAMSVRFHWPMHGPHALASTWPPTDVSTCCWPSRSTVARICSEPGVTIKLDLTVSPLALACSAIEAARDMSS